jgi:hypothetical protein
LFRQAVVPVVPYGGTHVGVLVLSSVGQAHDGTKPTFTLLMSWLKLRTSGTSITGQKLLIVAWA